MSMVQFQSGPNLIFCVQGEFSWSEVQMSLAQFHRGPNLIFSVRRANFVSWKCIGRRFKSIAFQIRVCEPRTRSVTLKSDLPDCFMGSLSILIGFGNTFPIGLMCPDSTFSAILSFIPTKLLTSSGQLMYY